MLLLPRTLRHFKAGHVEVHSKNALLFALLLLLLCAGHAHCLLWPLDRGAKTLYFNLGPPNARGDYHFEFQTSNGITTKAAGNAFGASGVVQYVSKEGIPITMTYVADADGYHPDGDHIPSPPAYVRRALDYIRTHPAVDELKARRL